ncbi:MAG TPA: DUF6069 family protein [Segeticoccus sp.]|uniref:DUF6069 family protein n=1 Tax=Segeticoccus sp. TaxID=2706531 RepID=UPI002D7F253B|nr:DUF6069 family protein [Segeticoccus sp.]HET8601840.1 DUF6069 family protein [Segeticoccus sp.]
MWHQRSRTRTRVLTVLAAPSVALAAWAVVRGLGTDLVTDDGRAVGAASVVVVSLLAALAGWGVVRLLERHTRRPALGWGLVASATLSLSILGPSTTASGAALVGLVLLHLVTAAVVMGGFSASFGPAWPAHHS